MKKRLESELISIAHRILKLKNTSEIEQLLLETRKLYDALAVLKFVEDNINIVHPKIDTDLIEQKLEAILDIRQPTLSQQLTVLREAELVATRRDGKSIFYRISSQSALAVMQVLSQQICNI